nr:hypothetical protein [Tanacetum cinerariifolium]
MRIAFSCCLIKFDVGTPYVRFDVLILYEVWWGLTYFVRAFLNINKYSKKDDECKQVNLELYSSVSWQGKLLASNPENVRLTVLMKLQEALDEETILEEQMLALMHRFADRFTDRADMKKCVKLKDVRDELLNGRKTTVDDELQEHVKALLLNMRLLT